MFRTKRVVQNLADWPSNDKLSPDEQLHKPGGVCADGKAMSGAHSLRDDLTCAELLLDFVLKQWIPPIQTRNKH